MSDQPRSTSAASSVATISRASGDCERRSQRRFEPEVVEARRRDAQAAHTPSLPPASSRLRPRAKSGRVERRALARCRAAWVPLGA
jgi:hypothetical protein